MKIKLIAVIAGFAILLSSCAELTPQQRAILSGAETIASIAATAAATYYGGPAAGQLASAGLSALGNVLQGYVGSTVPKSIVETSPGVAGVGQALADVLPTSPVSQSTVNNINKAAQIAATLKPANIIPSVPAPVATPPPSSSPVPSP